MRLLKFSPQQIMENWPYIKECITVSLPPYVIESQDAMLRIQEQLLIEYLECWACIDDTNEQFLGLVTTKIAVDDITLTRNLLIFTVTLTEEHENGIWMEGYKYLSAYAKAKNCSSIIAYTNQSNIIMLADALHGDTSWRMLQFPLV